MSERAPSVAGVAMVAIDCDHPGQLVQFWAALLGGEVEVYADGDARLRPAEGPVIDFLRVPDAKSGKNRLHLDLRSSDFDRAVEEAVSLGATKADDVYAGGTWQVLRDPEDNEFCILRPSRDQ
ncbi:MAG: VOC family protein [Actinomycetota bacterium]